MAPNTAYQVLVVTLLSIGVLSLFLLASWEEQKKPRLRSAVVVAAWGGMIACLVGCVIVRCFSACSVSNDGELIVVRDKTGRVVEVSDSSVWTNGRTASFVTTWAIAASSVQPITDNPKVRRLHYEAMVQVTDPAVFMQTCGPMLGQADTVSGNLQRLKDTLGYQLFEFNNARSKDLAKFYNPLSLEQTKELESMLRAYLDETLKPKGVAFVRLQAWSVE
ncbi:MAG: hypothetical protein WC641_02000 [Patescibacteria group bacterium]